MVHKPEERLLFWLPSGRTSSSGMINYLPTVIAGELEGYY